MEVEEHPLPLGRETGRVFGGLREEEEEDEEEGRWVAGRIQLLHLIHLR